MFLEEFIWIVFAIRISYMLLINLSWTLFLSPFRASPPLIVRNLGSWDSKGMTRFTILNLWTLVTLYHFAIPLSTFCHSTFCQMRVCSSSKTSI